MRDSETTNLLLLLMLFVLLIGFGFLVPILWIVGAVIGLWVSAIAIGAISRKSRAGFEAVSSSSNDAVQWCFILVTMGSLIWKYFDSSNNEYLFALTIPALFALIKGISYWGTVSIRRKYRKVNTDDS